MSSIMKAIRAAVLPGSSADALLLGIESEASADALLIETPPDAAYALGGQMTVQQSQTGPASAAAGAIATVIAAASGGDDGYKAAMSRITAVTTAEGIKGDAGRMNAALELADKSPEMSAEAIIGFVTTNVPAASAEKPDGGATPAASAGANPTNYEAQRVAAASLAHPQGSSTAKAGAKIDRDAIFAARRNQPKGE
jgi:hypothetical protein